MKKKKDSKTFTHPFDEKNKKKVQAYFSTDSIRGKRKGKRDGPV